MPEDLTDQRCKITFAYASWPRCAEADGVEQPLVGCGQPPGEQGRVGPGLKDPRDLDESAHSHAGGLPKPGPTGKTGESTTPPMESSRTCGARIPSARAESIAGSAASADSSAARWRAGRKPNRIRCCVSVARDVASNRSTTAWHAALKNGWRRRVSSERARAVRQRHSQSDSPISSSRAQRLSWLILTSPRLGSYGVLSRPKRSGSATTAPSSAHHKLAILGGRNASARR